MLHAVTAFGRRLVDRPDLAIGPLRRLAERADGQPLRRALVDDVRPEHAVESHDLIAPPTERPDARTLRGFVLADALVEGDTSGVVIDDRLLLAPGWQRPGVRLRSPLVRGHHDGIALIVDAPAAVTVPVGLHLAGHWTATWFHWLIDTLPRAELARLLPPGLRDVPALVPAHVLERPTWRQALATFTDPDRAIPLAPGVLHHVERLVWVDPARALPPAGPDAPGEDPTGELALARFRHELRSAHGIGPATVPDRRIYVARGAGSDRRRAHNEDELVAVAVGLGYEVVQPDRLDLTEQVRTFASAARLVGTHGSAWANAIACSTGARALIVDPEERVPHRYADALAAVAGLDLTRLVVPARGPKDLVFGAPFHVDPEGFRAALVALDA